MSKSEIEKKKSFLNQIHVVIFQTHTHKKTLYYMIQSITKETEVDQISHLFSGKPFLWIYFKPVILCFWFKSSM